MDVTGVGAGVRGGGGEGGGAGERNFGTVVQ